MELLNPAKVANAGGIFLPVVLLVDVVCARAAREKNRNDFMQWRDWQVGDGVISESTTEKCSASTSDIDSKTREDDEQNLLNPN